MGEAIKKTNGFGL